MNKLLILLGVLLPASVFALELDEFNGTSLNPQWEWYDPLANSTLDVSNGHLNITVPTGGTSHSLVVGNTNAPRVRQVWNNTDVEVFAKFDALPMVINEQTGITFEKNETEMLIFDWVSNGTNVAIEEWWLTPTAKTLRNKLYINTTPPKNIRIKRVGNVWSVYYSHGDETWTKIDTFTYIQDVNKIGLTVTNWGAVAPMFSTAIDYFRIYGKNVVSDATSQTVTHCAASVDSGADVDSLVEVVAAGKRCKIDISALTGGNYTIKARFVNIDAQSVRTQSDYSSTLNFFKPTN